MRLTMTGIATVGVFLVATSALAERSNWVPQRAWRAAKAAAARDLGSGATIYKTPETIRSSKKLWGTAGRAWLVQAKAADKTAYYVVAKQRDATTNTLRWQTLRLANTSGHMADVVLPDHTGPGFSLRVNSLAGSQCGVGLRLKNARGVNLTRGRVFASGLASGTREYYLQGTPVNDTTAKVEFQTRLSGSQPRPPWLVPIKFELKK